MIRRKRSLFLMTAFAALFLYASSSSEDWKLEKNEAGIIVYTRKTEGSSFKEFKADVILENCSIKQVLDIIFDVKNYDRLFPDLYGQKVLKNISEYHNIQYVVINAPWPVADRDNISELQAKISEDGKSALVSIKLLPDYTDTVEGLVRVRRGQGFWQLKALAGEKVEVVYQYHSDPGGRIPAWLANSFVVKHPFKTMENLKERVKKLSAAGKETQPHR